MKKRNNSFVVKSMEKTDIGMKRQENQDRILCVPQCGFYALSDGMGGVIEGAKTAEMVTDSMTDIARHVRTEWEKDRDTAKAAAALQEGLQKISDYIYQNGNAEGYSMYGATYVAVMFLGSKVVWLNMGDSRAYAVSGNGQVIKQITVDHNLAQIAFEAGRFTREELKNNQLSSHLTRYVGMKAPAEADVFITDVREQEKILLCSDGLYGLISDEEIRKIMKQHKSRKRICDILIEMANKRGGKDNISAIYMEILR